MNSLIDSIKLKIPSAIDITSNTAETIVKAFVNPPVFESHPKALLYHLVD